MQSMCVRSAALMTVFAASLALAPAKASQEGSARSPQPAISVAEPTKDFGKVTTGSLLAHTFVLSNEGRAPVEIREIRPGMGPISIPHFDRTIAPGGRGEIRVEIDALRLAGTGTARIEVLTSDPAQPSVFLVLSWAVAPAVVSAPDRARWLFVQHEPEGTIRHRLSAKDGQPFRVVSVEVPGPHLRASFEPIAASGEGEAKDRPQWTVDLTLDPAAPIGPVEGIVVVRTDHPEQSRVPIPVSGFVRPRYVLQPEWGRTSRLGQVALSEPTDVTFKLRNFASEPVSVLEVKTTIAGITGSVTPATVDGTRQSVSGVGHHFDVTLRLDPSAMAPGAFEGKVVVHLSDPRQPTVEMPLSGELVPSTTPAS